MLMQIYGRANQLRKQIRILVVVPSACAPKDQFFKIGYIKARIICLKLLFHKLKCFQCKFLPHWSSDLHSYLEFEWSGV